MTAPPFGVYVHFPWCVSKCPYCDFNSHALKDAVPERQYLDALRRDLEHQLASPLAQDTRSVVSVFLGGGTPSLFSPQAIGEVLAMLRAALPFAPDVEITMEANPGTIERGRFTEYAAAGVNRVSLGAQSFDDAQLRKLGRIHAADETRIAAAELHAAGLANFNLDVMYGLPGQDAAGALADIEAALSLAPAQVSHYHLTLEPGTPFAAKPPPALPDDENTERMLEGCQSRLDVAGYARYEVSAYARPGRECVHNLVYWRFGDYLGLGAGAHGKRSLLDAAGRVRGIHRTEQVREPRRYQRDPAATLKVREVDLAQRPFEFMLNALRLTGGIERSLFEVRT
ncbi:MAG: radical SAM family heme chaperone HemW, partial [Xanthomonadales bacterium]|nr:radical SAM family heme chaperone HemW [Xanthomonadales bacterium]